MGNSSGKGGDGKFGKKSTAKEVVDGCGTGRYLSGKTALVTGGNSGIGLETCKALMHAGCRVILCSRSVDAGKKALEAEVAQPGHGKYTVADWQTLCVVKQLDLNSLKSVSALAAEVLKEEKSIDLLVCNAGIMALPTRETTADGFEKQLGVNFHGHLHLIQLLLPKMLAQAPAPARVVVLSSTAHDMGNVDVSDLHFTKGRTYTPWVSYGQSKQADLLLAKEVADRTKGTNVTSVSVHPGVIATNLWRTSGALLTMIVDMFVMDKTIPQGAATTLYACVAPEVAEETMRGAYLVDCHASRPRTECARDEDGKLRKALWTVASAEIAEVVSSWDSADSKK